MNEPWDVLECSGITKLMLVQKENFLSRNWFSEGFENSMLGFFLKEGNLQSSHSSGNKGYNLDM